MRRILTPLMVPLMASALFLAGCAGPDAGTTTGTSSGEDAASTAPDPTGDDADDDAGDESGDGGAEAAGDEAGDAAGTDVDVAAWDFSAESLDGSTFDGSSLAGTPTVLWFWAPWCPTCRAQIPTVTGLAEEYDGEVEFVGAGGLASGPEIRELAEEIPHVTHLVDVDGAVWEKFGVTAQSTFAVIDADGEVVADGYLEDDALQDLVAELAG